jgi:hypothetical protein
MTDFRIFTGRRAGPAVARAPRPTAHRVLLLLGGSEITVRHLTVERILIHSNETVPGSKTPGDAGKRHSHGRALSQTPKLPNSQTTQSDVTAERSPKLPSVDHARCSASPSGPPTPKNCTTTFGKKHMNPRDLPDSPVAPLSRLSRIRPLPRSEPLHLTVTSDRRPLESTKPHPTVPAPPVGHSMDSFCIATTCNQL